MESDPAYRERHREAQRRYRATHKAERAERRRFKRRNDPVYRERLLELERFWRRRMYFQEVYGISLEDYDIMLARQNGLRDLQPHPGQTFRRRPLPHQR